VRIAVISPFVDRQHGTERVLAEQLSRLSTDHHCELKLYSQRVCDLSVSSAREKADGELTGITWRRVPYVPGPHILQYVFWFFANSICRWWDRRFRRASYDLLFSVGINALDADAIAVHIVFHEFYRQIVSQLRFLDAPISSLPRRLHRRLYYKLIMMLERHIYSNPSVHLTAVSGLVAGQLREHFKRSDVHVIPNGVSTKDFNSFRRLECRKLAREQLGFDAGDFVLLLLGNDWVKKGVPCLLRAIAANRDLPTKTVIAGLDDRSIFDAELKRLDIEDRVRFCPPRRDVMIYYAAADAYVGPSVEDAYGLPILEAMACALPVIASIRAGASEVIQHGVNGLLLQDPADSQELARHISDLVCNPDLCRRLSEGAEIAARRYDWAENAQELMNFLNTVVARQTEATGNSV